jgi:proline iminopeptidase
VRHSADQSLAAGKTLSVLLLPHGGPGATHELYECFDGYLPVDGIEYI